VPLAVTPVAECRRPPAARVRFTRRVFGGTTGLTVWTRQLAGLVGSGLPLERALTALADESEDPRQRELLSHLKSEVNAGSSFARALATAPREFDDVYRAVVAAGEQSGALGAVLERLADDLEQRQALRAQAARRDALPGHRVGDRAGDRDLPRHLRGAAGGLGLHQLQARAAGADGGDAGLSAFVRQWGWAVALALAGGGCCCCWHAPRRGLSRAQRRRCCCGCRWWAAWRAATTRRASAARWPCWPAPACPS
jgi:general secretion pathway protein F